MSWIPAADRKSVGMRVAAATLLSLALISVGGNFFPTADAVNSFAPLLFGVGLGCALVGIAAARKLLLVVGCLTAVAAGERLMYEPFRTIGSAPIGGRTVTIVTHNVRVDNLRPAETVVMLGGFGADILLLQETDGSVGPLLRSLARRYPFSSQCGQRGCSLAILSRWPIVRTHYRIRGATGRPIGPPLVWATIAPPDLPPFDVVSIHLPWPLPAAVQAARRAELAGAIGRLATDRLVLAGDFNLTPWSVAMERLDRDLAPLTRVTRATWSFPARFGGGAAAPFPILPIDQLLAGPGWAVRSVERLPRTGSDHYPLRIRLVMRD